MIESVVSIESPVHVDQLTRRLMEAFGITRAGVRVQQAVKDAISSGARNNLFRASGDFLYLETQSEFPIRNRANLESVEKKALFVAPEEWDRAIKHVIIHAFQISGDDLVSDTLGMLGFKRATKAVVDIVWKRVNELTRTEIIEIKSERYSLKDS
jgi:hypothetical protein